MTGRRGLSGYLFLIIALVLLFLYIPGLMSGKDSVPNSVFERYLDEEKIQSAVISQNAQVPTGTVQFYLKSGGEGRIYVSDVKEAEEALEKSGAEVTVRNVSREGMFSSIFIPVIISAVLMLIIFSVIGRQSAGGGGGANARMMNFGKSRARMSTDAD